MTLIPLIAGILMLSAFVVGNWKVSCGLFLLGVLLVGVCVGMKVEQGKGGRK